VGHFSQALKSVAVRTAPLCGGNIKRDQCSEEYLPINSAVEPIFDPGTARCTSRRTMADADLDAISGVVHAGEQLRKKMEAVAVLCG
jgi:hypothetical protein